MQVRLLVDAVSEALLPTVDLNLHLQALDTEGPQKRRASSEIDRGWCIVASLAHPLDTAGSFKRSVTLTERQQMALVKKEQEMQLMISNIHKRNANGETPLHVAAIKVSLLHFALFQSQGKLELCEQLIQQGARVNTRDHAG
jgi:hypothetical protein